MAQDEGKESSVTISYRVAKGIADQMDEYVLDRKLFRNRSEFSSMAVRYFLERLNEADEKRVYSQKVDVQRLTERERSA